jgi:hypothetical protein
MPLRRHSASFPPAARRNMLAPQAAELLAKLLASHKVIATLHVLALPQMRNELHACTLAPLVLAIVLTNAAPTTTELLTNLAREKLVTAGLILTAALLMAKALAYHVRIVPAIGGAILLVRVIAFERMLTARALDLVLWYGLGSLAYTALTSAGGVLFTAEDLR